MIVALTLVVFSQLGVPSPLADLSTSPATPWQVYRAWGVDGGIVSTVASSDGVELWRVNVSPPSMTMLIDLFPGPSGGVVQVLGETNAGLVFWGNDGLHGLELWVSDGTSAGTRMLVDLNPAGSTSQQGWLAATGGRLFFVACPPSTGCEVYVTDGTTQGTHVTADRSAGPSSFGPTQLTTLGSEVWFNEGGHRIVATDGTPAGTHTVFEFPNGDLASVGFGRVGTKLGLVSPNALSVVDLTQVPLTVSASLPFSARAYQFAGNETALFVSTSDCGYSGCTYYPPLRWQGASLSFMGVNGSFASSNQNLYLGDGTSLWKVDSSDAGVTLVSSSWGRTLFSGPGGLVGTNQVFDGTTLWPNPRPNEQPLGWFSHQLVVAGVVVADVPAGTSTTVPLNGPATSGSLPAVFTVVGHSVAMLATGDMTGREPFVAHADGGVSLLVDTTPGSNDVAYGATLVPGPGFALLTAGSPGWLLGEDRQGSAPFPLPGPVDRSFGLLSGRVAYLESGAPRLWLVSQFASPQQLPLSVTPLAASAATSRGLFFTARSVFGEELWFTDGTAGSTLELDLRPGLESSAPEQLVPFGDGIAFSALDGAGRELWLSDGTRAGTGRVADIQPGPLGSRPQLATSLGSKLVFFADDGVHGLEPWVWDGTEAKLLVDLVPGSEGVVALRAQAVSGRVFFVVALPDGSRRLFRSDGTSAATVELLALSGNTWLDSVGGTLLFDNATAAHGLELWAWWPGLAAPREVVDLMPGPASSSPRPGEAADTLYVYAAMDPTVGVEPMGLTVDVTAPVITAMVTGTLADSGFYSSDVKVHFDVVDPEAQLTQSGCDDLSITADTAGTTVQCFAESAGGATTGSIRIKRDATAPVLGCPADALWADGGLALEVTATDTIDPKPTVTFEPPPETWSALTTAVKVSARDATGNLSTCEVTVRLPDEPTLQRPQAMSCTTTDIRWSFLALASLLMFRRRWKFTGW